MKLQQVIQADKSAGKVVQRHAQESTIIERRPRIGAAVLDADHGQLAYRRAEAERAIDHCRGAGIGRQAAAGTDEHACAGEGDRDRARIDQTDTIARRRRADRAQLQFESATGHENTGERIQRHSAARARDVGSVGEIHRNRGCAWPGGNQHTGQGPAGTIDFNGQIAGIQA